jgi:hypothetical protein
MYMRLGFVRFFTGAATAGALEGTVMERAAFEVIASRFSGLAGLMVPTVMVAWCVYFFVVTQ